MKWLGGLSYQELMVMPQNVLDVVDETILEEADARAEARAGRG